MLWTSRRVTSSARDLAILLALPPLPAWAVRDRLGDRDETVAGPLLEALRSRVQGVPAENDGLAVVITGGSPEAAECPDHERGTCGAIRSRSPGTRVRTTRKVTPSGVRGW